MQKILDRYKVGIEVVGINLQQGGVRPPEQVQAAFDDVLKAGRSVSAPRTRRRLTPTTLFRALSGGVAPEGRGRRLQGAHRGAGTG
jgi:hypothetical protein